MYTRRRDSCLVGTVCIVASARWPLVIFTVSKTAGAHRLHPSLIKHLLTFRLLTTLAFGISFFPCRCPPLPVSSLLLLLLLSSLFFLGFQSKPLDSGKLHVPRGFYLSSFLLFLSSRAFSLPPLSTVFCFSSLLPFFFLSFFPSLTRFFPLPFVGRT